MKIIGESIHHRQNLKIVVESYCYLNLTNRLRWLCCLDCKRNLYVSPKPYNNVRSILKETHRPENGMWHVFTVAENPYNVMSLKFQHLLNVNNYQCPIISRLYLIYHGP